MKATTAVGAVLAAALVAAGGYALYGWGMSRGMQMASHADNATAQGGADPGRKVLYWHDPMVPGHKFDKPGRSPFMDMDLVPVYADEGGDSGGVTISPRVQQNLGVRLAEAVRREVAPVVEAVGIAAYNERDLAVVQARATGFLEKLHVRAPLDPVRKGQPLAEMYVPDWVAAQEEYLGVLRMGEPGLDALREGALQRMRMAGMTEQHIERVKAEARVLPRLTLVAPIGGVVSELSAREGMTVMAGAPLFRINGLSTIWVHAEVPESQAAHVRPGTKVEARAAAFPGQTFNGRVSAILPEISAATRTVRARVELANPGGRLVPGMFATVNFTPASRREALMVPTEAVIQTGRRTVVIVAEKGADGRSVYRPTDVEIGIETDGMTEIRKGLEAGTQVVASGQFLIDSEASLRATATRLSDPPAAEVHTGDGRIEDVDGQSVLLSHGPIPSIQWGPMTMEFRLRKDVPVAGLKEGSEITFDFVQTAEGEYEITAIRPKAAAAAPDPALPRGGAGARQ